MTNEPPSLTGDQLDTLRHMLGINDPSKGSARPNRDYYCANEGDSNMLGLEALGVVERFPHYADVDHGGDYCYFRTTVTGRSAAIASFKTIQQPKKKRVYLAFLSACDYASDLTFREFLTDPMWAETRRAA